MGAAPFELPPHLNRCDLCEKGARYFARADCDVLARPGGVAWRDALALIPARA